MIKQFNSEDIDIIMKIWKDNNQKYQKFIQSKYWSDNYTTVKKDFLQNKIWVYTEAEIIKAYISVNSNNEITNIQVLPEIQREGIGEILVNKLKDSSNTLTVSVFEKNNDAIMFFKAMGFKKISEETNEDISEKYYIMRWGKGNEINTSFIYFNSSIKTELVNKYDSYNKVKFIDIHTTTNIKKNNFSINVSDYLQIQNNKTYIKDYISVRNLLNSCIKTKNVILFFDCSETYDYMYDVIKDVIKVKNANLKIVMHTPFSAEGTKKVKIYEYIKNCFSDYELVEIDYEKIGEDQSITFKEAFDMRDDELLKTFVK